MLNDWNADDTPVERALRTATADLRASLRTVIAEANAALASLDQGMLPYGGVGPTRILDDRKVNGYAGQVQVLLALPWDEDAAVRAQAIVETAGKVEA